MATMLIRANSKPQMDFLAASEYEVLYGGSAGGGKTQAIIIDPLRYIGVSDYRAIIFRESYVELQKAVMPEAIKIYSAAGGKWSEGRKRFEWASGAYIDLGYLESENDWTKYQGTQYVGQYFDELTNIRWINYDRLAMWNRASSGGILPYRRATANPGGVSHTEVKQYFIDTCPAERDGGEVFSELAQMRWQPMKSGKPFVYVAENGMVLSRRYIPARVFDNQDLLRNNPNYLAQLLKMPPLTRKAYLEGDWTVFEGQIWRVEWFEKFGDEVFSRNGHSVRLFNDGMDWDLAYTENEMNSASAFVRSSLGSDGNIYVTDAGARWLEFPSLIEWMKSYDAPHYVEAKASGKSAVQALRKMQVYAVEVKVRGGDKIARTKIITPLVAGKKVFIHNDVYDYLLFDQKQGILKFTGHEGEYTDLNDAFVQALNRHYPFDAPQAFPKPMAWYSEYSDVSVNPDWRDPFNV